MRLRNRTAVSEPRKTAAKRMTRLGIGEAIAWGTTCLSGTWRAFEDFEKFRTLESLGEARKGLETMLGVVDALEARMKD